MRVFVDTEFSDTTIINDVPDSDRRWRLNLQIRSGSEKEGWFSVFYIMKAPYSVSYSAWMSFVDGDKTELRLEDTGLLVKYANGLFAFGTVQDTIERSSMSAHVSWEAIKVPLRAAIVGAAEKNWKFAA